MPNIDTVFEMFGFMYQAGVQQYWMTVRLAGIKKTWRKMGKYSFDTAVKKDGYEVELELDGLLADSMIRESFWLFAYEIIIASFVFVFESCCGNLVLELGSKAQL